MQNNDDGDVALVAQIAATLANARDYRTLDHRAIARDAWTLLQAVRDERPQDPERPRAGFVKR
jgi:hypothetical protein